MTTPDSVWLHHPDPESRYAQSRASVASSTLAMPVRAHPRTRS